MKATNILPRTPMFDSFEFVRPVLSVDLDEGMFVELGCLHCRENGRARLGLAHPVRYYHAAIICDCGEQLVRFDLMTNGVIR